MPLSLTIEQFQIIQDHAQNTYPEECCGLLLGKNEAGCKRVQQVRPTPNVWNGDSAGLDEEEQVDVDRMRTRASRYCIAPQDMLAGMREARDRNLEIIGIYHSHPNHAAVPSECDRRLAWAQYSYLIVSVQAGRVTAAYSWVLDQEQRFQPEEIAIEGIKS
jgi:proteasome lid subunit RPN8/RPN11